MNTLIPPFLLQAFRAACMSAMATWRLRSALRWWRGVTEARALLRRVFATADVLWAARDVAGLYGDEWRVLRAALVRWVEYAEAKREKRALRAAEEVRG